MNAQLAELSPRDSIVDEAIAALSFVIPAGNVCALLDHPDHPNVGDSAIWLGERSFLRKNRNRVAYSCCVHTFNESALRRAMPRGIVLVHGGGNFGTLWPRHQELRERIFERLTDYRVVQLPQTIRYEDDTALRRTARLIAAHPDVHVLVRDVTSLEIARAELGAKASLCPDAAFLLAGQLRRDPPVVDCFVLARTDKERAVDGLARAFERSGLSVETADWLDEPIGLLHQLRDRFKYASRRPLASSRWFQFALLALWDRLAHERTQRGCRLLSRGRLVITDRLHAHILSTLLGIPHIVLDNSYGKLSHFIETWAKNNPLCHTAASLEQARELAQRLLRG